MAFFWSKKKKEQEELRTEQEPTGAVKVEEALLTALFGDSGMTKEKILEIPVVAACIDKLAGTVASLPIKLYRYDEKGMPQEVLDDVRLKLLNKETGDTLNAVEFWENMVEDYYLGKGAYAYINKEAGTWKSIHHVEESKVSILSGVDPIFKRYIIQIEGATYMPFEFLKLRRKPRDGMEGIPLYKEKPLIFAVAYATMVFEKSQVQKGGNKRGFIEAEHRLSEPAMKTIKEAWANLYSNDSDRVVILNDGAKFKESSNTSVEMQLYENKEINGNEICKMFGFPATILNGGATEADRAEYRDAVTRLLNMIEAALDTDLLLESEKGSFYFAFDTRELTRGNIKERYEAYKIGLEGNFLQIDEVREKEDMEPLGFNYIHLGLDSVLVNPKTGEVYTPNTNATAKMTALKGGEGSED